MLLPITGAEKANYVDSFWLLDTHTHKESPSMCKIFFFFFFQFTRLNLPIF